MKSRKTAKGPECIGSTVVGERGQIVIPKELRDTLKLKPGAKLLVIQHMNGAIVLLPAERMRDFLQRLTSKLQDIV
jgi:AbrB family looped-hinge helix DNA binding protein